MNAHYYLDNPAIGNVTWPEWFKDFLHDFRYNLYRIKTQKYGPYYYVFMNIIILSILYGSYGDLKPSVEILV